MHKISVDAGFSFPNRDGTGSGYRYIFCDKPPGETEEMILKMAREIGRLKLDGVKIHPLHIIKGTKLEEMWRQGQYTPLRLDEYLDLLACFLEYLWPKTVIQRIGADCPREFLISPLWILKKGLVLGGIEERLLCKGSFHGMKWGK